VRPLAPGPVLVATLVLVLAAGAAGAAEEVMTIPARPGVTQAFLLGRPARPPIASVVLFADVTASR
jgi:hypothetical protein